VKRSLGAVKFRKKQSHLRCLYTCCDDASMVIYNCNISELKPQVGVWLYLPRRDFRLFFCLAYTPEIPCTGSQSLYSRNSLFGVAEFILPKFPVTGSQSLYSRNSLFGVAEFMLPKFPVLGRGGCSLVNRETVLELRSELRSDALPATTIGFSGIRTHDSPRVYSNH